MKEINKQELERRIMGYFKRMKERRVPRIPLKQKGLYRIIGGNRNTLGTIEGRFIEALAYAVQEPGFPGDWCSWTIPDNCNHGHVEGITPIKIPVNRKLNYLLSKRSRK